MATKLDFITEAKIKARLEKHLEWNKDTRNRAEEARLEGNDEYYKQLSHYADRVCDILHGMSEILQTLGYNYKEVEPGKVEIYEIEKWTVMV